MNNLTINNGPLLVSIFALVISSISTIISIKSWYKNRVFYDLDIHQISGHGSEGELTTIKEKLNTNKYTILNTYQVDNPNNRGTVFILVGKVKK